MQALAAQQQMMHHPGQPFVPPQAQRVTNMFIGSISAGITDAFLNSLLSACGPIKAFKRLITPANKPQGFGFAEFEDPDGALRAMALLNGVELPALEDGAANKKLLVKADEKTKMFLDAYSAQKMRTDADEAKIAEARTRIASLVQELTQSSSSAGGGGAGGDGERYVIPPHLHDLQEADLPETQRGLVISEIAQFRERAARREREKVREVRDAMPALVSGVAGGGVAPPSGPKQQREWGRGGGGSAEGPGRAVGAGPQSYDRPVGFVAAGDDRQPGGKPQKSDEELEAERREARRKDEENSFRDRERRYEPRERTRIQGLERAIARVRAVEEAEKRDRAEMRARLEVWDDDESDEMFYTDRSRWRHLRARRLATEEAADAESRAYEERETENLRRESEEFLARQMEEMQALQEEQRNAGMLLDDGAPVKLNVSAAPKAAEAARAKPAPEKKVVLVADEDEEDAAAKRRKVGLVKLDFSAAESGEKARERLEKIRLGVPRDKETLLKAKVRWDGLSDMMVDRKFEPLVKRLMVKYLGELEDDDLVMFVLEHLKDHKGPAKLVEGLEPVLEEEASELVINVWRQVIFESMAYGEGLPTEKMMVD
ncbi:hypothetical protein PUNSTDRAFT_49469 [Punctularia strigosozonata HHB-11173 SS5]|uniref:uncharacterized protein n=1 Tax=Punctularia strigosozonata (strain HHB-11173) TaxID=741275 RepID=UPI0004417E4A|nr:uncharacterized protein PUNSTDRAFT_49469 [Punctularia strigosozonata HHB-11173 SS5]EIN12176.1 hypothetical protein PUNSTDRAFT_49469 [Punctularia strigosozonata HHB-11173 SS5]